MAESVNTSCVICRDRDQQSAGEYFCTECTTVMCADCTVRHDLCTEFTKHSVEPFVVVLQRGSLCKSHPERLAVCWCKTCSHAICTSCTFKHKDDDHKTQSLQPDVRHHGASLRRDQTLKRCGLVLEIKLNGHIEDIKFLEENTLCVLEESSIMIYKWESVENTYQLYHKTAVYNHKFRRIGLSPDRNIAYVTCSKCLTVHQYNRDTHQLVEAKSWSSAIFRDPIGLAVTPTGLLVIGVCSVIVNKTTVFIYQSNGTRVMEVTGQPARSVVFQSPRYISSDRDHVIVSDYDAHCVYVLDTNGSLRAILGIPDRYGSSTDRLCRPHGVCIDDTGHIIVADRDNNRISKFDANGIFLEHLLKQASDIKKPVHVDFTVNGGERLMLVGDASNVIKVFQM